MSIAALAKNLANKGRFGDNNLLHVSDAELRGLASLMPDGKLTTNPETGLPEAFFFLPFLAGLAPAAAAGAGAAGTAAGLTAGLGAAGLGAAGTAAATAPALAAGTLAATPATLAAPATGAGLGALGAGMEAGMGAAGGGLSALAPTAASAAPTAAATAPAVTGTATGVAGAGAGAGTTAPLTEATAALSAAAPDALTVTTTPITGQTATVASPIATPPPTVNPHPPIVNPIDIPGSAGMTPPSSASPIHTPSGVSSPSMTSANGIADLGVGADAAGNVTVGDGQGFLTGLGDQLSGFDPMALAPLAMMMGGGGGGGKPDEGDEEDPPDEYGGEPPVFPDGDYKPGIDAEWDYFPSYGGGGLVKKYATGGPVMASPMQPELPMTPGQPMQPMAVDQGQMGGGIAQLMSPPQMSMPEVPKSQTGSPYVGDNDPEKAAKQSAQDQELISETVQAINGQHPNPDAVLLAFINTFGEDALQDLVQRVRAQGDQGVGKSDGMSDSIPAMINGKEPAAISEGEYIMPADVVSGLGNGSTEAGARELDALSNRVRAFRQGGMVDQPPAMNSRKAMPV
jgi:hypothetical protein